MDEKNRKEAAASLLTDMEATAARMRELIVAMPPHDLLGYIYAQRMIKAMADQSDTQDQYEADGPDDLINENQFLLEYVHAVLASDVAPADLAFDEAKCAELYELGRKLRQQALFFAMATSADTKDGVFGPDTADIEFHAKSTWVTLRGNRYQVLEGEFYRYVLTPHNDVLKEVYGVEAADIAEGFQAMANATRSGHADAITLMMKQFEAAQAFAATQDQPLEDVMQAWVAANAEQSKEAGRAMDDMFRGGIANVSRHTKLPPTLLADLAYQRGEETEFFAAGDFAGTPYRTLPARKKPLIQLGSDYYAVDPCLARDAGYRALLYNLLQRRPDYKKTFEGRQKTMSEAAFADILAAQLPDATVFQEVYYKDPSSKQWSENDTLILVDDVLFLVEAKAGAAATIASPALDFGRHAQSVQDLVLKAYKQCERFFNYLNSSDEVPLYHLVDGKYEECGRVRRADYRVMVPIGLTVESFSPFSTYCKELPQVEPLLGRHAFISLSIDDLFVLKRFLPTPGEFAHYMEVRQAVAGTRRAHLFDELDHLGAYLKKNRFDQDIADQLKDGKMNMIIWSGMSDIVDKSFEGEDWESRPFPTQDFPKEVRKLLGALDGTRARGWLSAESHIRDLGEEGRSNLAKMLFDLRQTLNQHPARYFVLCGDGGPLFVWLQQHNHQVDWGKVNDKASAAAVGVKASNVVGIVAEASADGTYHRAQSFVVNIPTERTEENAHIYEDATRMAHPKRTVNFNQPKNVVSPAKTKKLGRNDPCPCSSGLKYKKCHGR
ncbi:YecA family protein [Burkholderia pseudomallei]|uniref:YecA family protein n=1 Tax=Burkholderia pseudomallei TaxID=28450 RepID=UPI000F06899C|nr:SEC-C metal-binding domain-containing protein [Burkholderia pseudomallei]MCV9912853.1 SEC-C metal-binding domain-containing protein [Burkholderia pseudomallei]MCV9970072.1 SEC-C metal-binding domain-containing protein [Burkholderia pseudomallei]MCW0069128.1 SEC-C metal-binding domain-containing protein [Burkholderia pseudomallei]